MFAVMLRQDDFYIYCCLFPSYPCSTSSELYLHSPRISLLRLSYPPPRRIPFTVFLFIYNSKQWPTGTTVVGPGVHAHEPARPRTAYVMIPVRLISSPYRSLASPPPMLLIHGAQDIQPTPYRTLRSPQMPPHSVVIIIPHTTTRLGSGRAAMRHGKSTSKENTLPN